MSSDPAAPARAWAPPPEWLDRLQVLSGRDLRAAQDLAITMRAQGMSHPLVHNLVAFRLEQDGRFEQAVVELGAGLAHAPGDPHLLTALGFCLIKLERRVEAANIFDTAARLHPGFAPARFGVALSLEWGGDLDGAFVELEAALAIDPAYADAIGCMAALAARRGAPAEAKALAQRALRLDPGQPAAQLALARSALAEKRFDEARSMVEACIASFRGDAADRSEMHLLLGDALDALEDYDGAFGQYQQGKAIAREAFAGLYAAPGRESAAEAAVRQRTAFEALPAEAWPAPAASQAQPRHAFLLGFPRSGTTLFENVLAGHPDVCTLEERPTLVDAEAAFLTPPDGMEKLAAATEAELAPYREAYWRRVAQWGAEPGGRLFVDKHPLATLRLPIIARLFPEARILFAVRDPREVVFSCFRRGFRMNQAMYEFTQLSSAAAFYDAVMSAAAVYRRRLPLAFHDVRYEDLVVGFDETAASACAFLGLTWDERMRAFDQQARRRAVRTRSGAQLTEGLYSHALRRSRRYDQALQSVATRLAPWVQAYGYAEEEPGRPAGTHAD